MSDKFSPSPEDVRTLRHNAQIGAAEATGRLRTRLMLKEVSDLRAAPVNDPLRFDRLLDLVEAVICSRARP